MKENGTLSIMQREWCGGKVLMQLSQGWRGSIVQCGLVMYLRNDTQY